MCLNWQDYLSNGQFDEEKLAHINQLRDILDFYEKQLEVEGE